MSTTRTCPSCAAPVTDRYCAKCGEKILVPGDHQLRHYLEALLNAFTFAESKFWRTLKAVIVWPGELSRAYMQGRRVPFMRPVGFFFLANFLYFALPGFQTFTVPLSTQMDGVPYKEWVRSRVEQKLAHTGGDLEELRARFDPASSANAKLLLVIMVFFLALPIALLHIGRYRYVSAAITAAFELMSFYLWTCTILLGLLVVLLVHLLALIGVEAHWLNDDNALIWPIVLLHFLATIGISRRLFKCSRIGAAWRALVMFGGLAIAISAYRLVLFEITLWQVG